MDLSSEILTRIRVEAVTKRSSAINLSNSDYQDMSFQSAQVAKTPNYNTLVKTPNYGIGSPRKIDFPKINLDRLKEEKEKRFLYNLAKRKSDKPQLRDIFNKT